MAQFAHPIVALSSDNDILAYDFNQQNQCLTVIKLLCQLTKAVQQHRGATMGHLSGEPAFLEQITRLQKTITRILLYLNHTNQQHTTIPKDLIVNINNDWKTIVIGWREDKIIHNFEFHCHLVDSLKKRLKSCIKQLLPQQYHGDKSYQDLLETLFVQLPNNIESIATVRGLSTSAAVIKACGKDSHSKLSYLLKEIPMQNRQLIERIGLLMPGITMIKEQNRQLQKYLLSIKMSILESAEITVDSASLFSLSTDIIDAHWAVIEQGIPIVEKRLFQIMIEP